ncbi:unnamed protein product, partial [Larinioides sclopetarius]
MIIRGKIPHSRNVPNNRVDITCSSIIHAHWRNRNSN